METDKTQRVHNWIVNSLIVGTLLFAIASTVFIVLSNKHFDSDNASEVMLAKEMIATGSLLPETWFYSTEVRTLHTQLLIAPLLAISGDMILSRNLADLIVVLLLGFVAYLYARSIGLSRPAGALVSALFLTPFSESLASMNFTGGFYSPYLIWILLTLIMFNRLGRNLRKVESIIILSIILVIALLLGLSGSRFVVSLFVPLLLTEILLVFKREDTLKDLKSRLLAPGVRSGILLFAIGTGGYVLHKLLVARGFFHIVDWAEWVFIGSQGFFNRIGDVFTGMFVLFGSFTSFEISSIGGLIGLLEALFLISLLVLAARFLGRVNALEERQRRLVLFFGVSFFVTGLFHMFSSFAPSERYHILVLLMAFPMVVMYIEALPKGSILRVVSVAFVAVTILGAHYLILKKSVEFASVDTAQHQAAAYLEEHGFDFGYATFWNANSVSMLTNGKVEISSFTGDWSTLTPGRWLSTSRHFNPSYHPGRTFILLTREEESQAATLLADAKKEGEVADYVVYVWDKNPLSSPEN